MKNITLHQTIKGYSMGWKGLWEHFINLLGVGCWKIPMHDHELIIKCSHSGIIDTITVRKK